jgi:hypothetical protein
MGASLWFLIGLLAAPSSYAAQQRVDRPSLCSVATAVVVAEVTTIETQWAAGERGGIERRAWLSVLQTPHGEPQDTLEIILPGGSMGEISQWVEDVPKLELDRPYLLFLGTHQERLQIIGGDQGAIPIASEAGKPGEPVTEALKSLGGCRAKN